MRICAVLCFSATVMVINIKVELISRMATLTIHRAPISKMPYIFDRITPVTKAINTEKTLMDRIAILRCKTEYPSIFLGRSLLNVLNTQFLQ